MGMIGATCGRTAARKLWLALCGMVPLLSMFGLLLSKETTMDTDVLFELIVVLARILLEVTR